MIGTTQHATSNLQSDLERDLRRERFAMRSLLEFARTLTPDLGPVGILKSIQRTIMGKALITDGFAYLGEDDGHSRRYRLVSHSGLRAFPFPETITFEELETWIFSPPEGVRTTLPVFDSEQNDIIAFLGFGKPLVPGGELQGEDNYLESLSLLAGMAITNARLFEAQRERERLEGELRLAREIQQSLLPAELPHIEGLSFFAYNRQSELVGGDYYDVIALSEHEALLVIADVVGKGASAAILMSNVQASLHALVPQLRSGMISLTKLVFILNDLIVESTSAERFVTAVLAIADTLTNELRTVVCGHPRPILISPNGSISEITACGFPLGVIAAANYEEVVTKFTAGTSLFLYTDGLSEATTSQGGTMVGTRGVNDLAKQIALSSDANAVENVIFTDAHLMVRDDLTLLVAKRK
ncbi:MAG TPA: SpoIIE family protein phosphatase [Candidatus Kapabacteria bacterium]|nr:SpoIIE family protein phosphatase [Candidatus Kapabacteria bacterium]